MIEAPIFVIGAGRSGTTLLRTALAAHPRIAVTPETHYMKMADRFGAADRPDPPDLPAFRDRLAGWSRFRDLGVPADRVFALASSSGPPTFRSIFAAMLAAYAEAHGKPRAGEKTPGHYRYWQRLLDWFPDARIVAIRRDPRAVTASALRAPWVETQLRPGGALSPFVRRLRLWHVASQARGWTRIYGDHVPAAARDPRVLVIGYEDLARDPERVLRAVCGHVDEAFAPEMLTGRGAVGGAAASALKDGAWAGWVEGHEAKAAQAISAGDLDAWRHALRPVEQAMIEAICGDAMDRAGYPTETTATRRRIGHAVARAVSGANRAENWARRAVGR